MLVEGDGFYLHYLGRICPVYKDLQLAEDKKYRVEVIDIMEKEDYPGKALKISEKVTKVWKEWQEKYDVIGDIRGIGCMMGVEFVKSQATKEPNPEIVSKIIAYAAQHGLLLENAGAYGNVIRFLSPLCITDAQLDAGLAIYEEALKASL